MDKDELVLSRREAADRLRVSVPVLDRLIASGEVRKLQVGRRVLVPVQSLQAFVEPRGAA